MNATVIPFPRSVEALRRQYDQLLGRIAMAVGLSAALLKRAEATLAEARARS